MSLEQTIWSAFKDVPYPGDGNITPSNYGEDKDIANYFRVTSQRGHPVASLHYHESALCLFTDDAFHYWLPSFLVAAATDPEEADVILDGLVFSFQENLHNCLDRLSHAQLRAALAYFQSQADKDDNDLAVIRTLKLRLAET